MSPSNPAAMTATLGLKRHRMAAEASLNIRTLSEKYSGSLDRDLIFQEIYDYLYAKANKNKVNKLIEVYTGNTGLCTTKWLEETVAFKCYDCESDTTCAVCLECFFKSNHEGHRYRLTRTSGGCCDCGDDASWKPQGSCSKHKGPITVEDERALLDIFNEGFIARLRDALQQIVEDISSFLKDLDPTEEQFAFVLMLFLDELMKVTPAFRYAFFEVIDRDTLALWLQKHQILSTEIRRTFNSLYLTVITSMAFKMLFAEVYIELYCEIVQPYMKNPDDWHLKYLSVQLFTYSRIATKAISFGFLEKCIYPMLNRNSVDPKLGTMQFPRLDRRLLGLYLCVTGDFTYVLNHEPVIKEVISTPRLHNMLFRILGRMQMMNVMQRETSEHVQYENTGCVISFTNEHTCLLGMRHFAEVCKVDINKTAILYRSLNAYIRDVWCPWQFNSLKLCRSFHIPLVRFFVIVVNIDHIARLCASTCGPEELQKDVIVTAFDDEVLLYVMRQAMTVIRFTMEIKHNLWVYNGISMRNQSDHYRQVMLIQYDVAAIQVAAAILGLRKRAGLTTVDPLTVLYEEAFKTHVTCQEGSATQEQEMPGDTAFKVSLFMYLLIVVLHDIKNLEVFSIARSLDNTDPEYVRRGNPLIMMDIVSALAMGKLEFREVTKMVDIHWRRHPHVAKVVEQLATVTYSEVADKTYVRPNNETYRLIDVLWNPHNYIADLSIPQEVLKRGGYGILGPQRSANILQPEYYRAQNAVMEGMNKTKCFQVIWQFLEALANLSPAVASATDEPGDNSEGTTDPMFYDAYDEEQLDEVAVTTRYFDVGIDWSEPIGSRWNEALLGAIKTINLMMETSDCIGLHNASKLVDMLEAILSRIGDETLVKTAITYTINMIRDRYQLAQSRMETCQKEGRMQNVKSLQLKFMSKMLAQQKKVKLDDIPDLVSPMQDEEHQTCILCKQKMDDENRMSFMCLVATNSVMRLCTHSIDGSASVYAKASLPLRSSIISCCGHVAHTRCINDHRQKQCDAHALSVHGIQRNTDEYFCPICKALCNYTLEYIPDSQIRTGIKTNAKDVLSKLCNYAWRYTFCANWIPSPVRAKFNVNPHVMYTFNIILPLNDIVTVPGPERSFTEDLNIKDVQNDAFGCSKCMLTDIAVGYKPQCGALFYPKESQTTYLDREYLALQLTEYLNVNPHRMQLLYKLLKIDPNLRFSRRMTTAYCRAIFSGQRSLYGVQNWRHVNAGTVVDPQIWLLYNHVIATCSCSRNQLTVKPSLIRHLVRNCYSTEVDEAQIDCRGDVTQLDTAYFDVLPNDLIIPKLHSQPDERSSLVTVLVEVLTEDQLKQVAKALDLQVRETEYHDVKVFDIEKNDGKLKLDVTCAWSKDVIREFLMSFIQHTTTKQESLECLAKCLGTLMMQVIERMVLNDIKKEFARFVDGAADAEASRNEYEEFSVLRFRRHFLKTFYSTYFDEYMESAELPADLTARVDWMGLNEHSDAFRTFNGYVHVDEEELHGCSNKVQRSPEAMEIDVDTLDNSFMDVDTQMIGIKERLKYAQALQDVHCKTVATFIQTLPKRADGEMADQVKTYLYDQVMTLIKVRQLHSLVEGGIGESEFNSLLQALESDCNPCESAQDEEGVMINKIFSAHAQSHTQDPGNTKDDTQYYKGMDFVRRINEETYKVHCNFAFFEVIRHMVPTERHLLDFVECGGKLGDEISKLQDTGDILRIAKDVAQLIYGNVKMQGYLNNDYKPDMDAITSSLLKHLNVVMDIAFWVIFSVYETDEETSTKVSYAHLQTDNVRFNLLVEATGVKELALLILKTCAETLDADTKSKLMLMRATNHETMAPLISAYEYIDFAKHLADDAWELIRTTTFRMCPNCGTQPPNPLICLICGTIICHQSMCCDKNKDVNVLQMLNALERFDVTFRANDLTHIYNDEVVAHTNTCGGGQGLYISPYNCFLVFMDEKRHCVTYTFYSDNYGNKDLHSTVHGPVMLSQTRLANITNSFCQGRLTHEIINVQKEASE